MEKTLSETKVNIHQIVIKGTVTNPYQSNIIAPTYKEAVAKAINCVPGLHIDEVDGKKFIGICSASGEIIVDGEEYYKDQDGYFILKKCVVPGEELMEEKEDY